MVFACFGEEVEKGAPEKAPQGEAFYVLTGC